MTDEPITCGPVTLLKPPETVTVTFAEAPGVTLIVPNPTTGRDLNRIGSAIMNFSFQIMREERAALAAESPKPEPKPTVPLPFGERVTRAWRMLLTGT